MDLRRHPVVALNFQQLLGHFPTLRTKPICFNAVSQVFDLRFHEACVEAKLQTAGERRARLHEAIAIYAVGAPLKAQANQHRDLANLHGIE